MSWDFVLTGMSGNCQGLLLHVRNFFCGPMLIFGLLNYLFSDIRNLNNGISGEIVFTASVVLDTVGKTDHYDLGD